MLPKFLYKPMMPLPDLYPFVNKFIEIRVHKCFVNRTNKAFRQRVFFGADQYTSDSDIVCILQHSGLLRVPSEEIQDDSFEAYAVILKVLKGRPNYKSVIKHGLKSRKLEVYEGHSLKAEKLIKLDWIGSDEELFAMAQDMPTIFKHRPRREYEKLLQKAQIVLARAPENVYKVLNDATVFNLSFEVASQYNLSRLADKSPDDTTFQRMQQHALYLENDAERFEIAHLQKNEFRFAKVLQPRLKTDRFYSHAGVPLLNQYLEVIFDKVEWHEFVWGPDSLEVVSKKGSYTVGSL